MLCNTRHKEDRLRTSSRADGRSTVTIRAKQFYREQPAAETVHYLPVLCLAQWCQMSHFFQSQNINMLKRIKWLLLTQQLHWNAWLIICYVLRFLCYLTMCLIIWFSCRLLCVTLSQSLRNFQFYLGQNSVCKLLYFTPNSGFRWGRCNESGIFGMIFLGTFCKVETQVEQEAHRYSAGAVHWSLFAYSQLSDAMR
jgi:hypothetical protein